LYQRKTRLYFYKLKYMVNALTTSQISEQRAQDIIAKSYEDYTQMPAWFLISAAKAQLLDLVIVMPGNEGKLESDRPANRAEIAALLYISGYNFLSNAFIV